MRIPLEFSLFLLKLYAHPVGILLTLFQTPRNLVETPRTLFFGRLGLGLRESGGWRILVRFS